MDPQSEPAKPGDQPFEWPSDEEFAAWLKAHPENYEWWQDVIERIAQNEKVNPEMRAAAQRAVAKRREARGLKVVQDKFAAIGELMRRPPGSMLAEDRLAQCNTLMDELTDALLEISEPHRSQFLKQVLPLREFVRSFKFPD